MWVEFVGFRPCSARFFSGYSGFPSPEKPTLPNSNYIWSERTRLNELLSPKCFAGKQTNKQTTKREKYLRKRLLRRLGGVGSEEGGGWLKEVAAEICRERKGRDGSFYGA